jgi:hypothetical protein
MKVTIHQPDFMPWFGFFNKVAKVDTWILLDHVENNPKDAAFWGRRVQILVNGKPTWLSIPLRKSDEAERFGVPIKDMLINMNNRKIFEKNLRTVQMAYARAPYYRRHKHLVEEYFMDEEPSLLKRNMRFIKAVMVLLDMHQEIVSSSTLGVTTRSTQLLIDLLNKVGADTYVCGGGASGYQDDSSFAKNGIKLVYNNFTHPIYSQLRTDDIVQGLSIIDALFNAPNDYLRECIFSV